MLVSELVEENVSWRFKKLANGIAGIQRIGP